MAKDEKDGAELTRGSGELSKGGGELTKDERFQKSVRKEESRLRRVFKSIEPGRKAVANGLIPRAAFLRASLEELERDLRADGFTEGFQQGEQAPYIRERPASRIYASMNQQYQKITKQLTELLPKEAPKAKAGDDFEEF